MLRGRGRIQIDAAGEGDGHGKARRKGRALTWDRFVIRSPRKYFRRSPDVHAKCGGLEQVPPQMRERNPRERALAEKMNRRAIQYLNKNLRRCLICGTARSGTRGRAGRTVSLDAGRMVDAASRASWPNYGRLEWSLYHFFEGFILFYSTNTLHGTTA